MAAAADDPRALRAEVDLLAEYASGEKTFAQVRKDAQKFEFASAGLRRLIHTNASRGLTERLKQLTGVDKESLVFLTSVTTMTSLGMLLANTLSRYGLREFKRCAPAIPPGIARACNCNDRNSS